MILQNIELRSRLAPALASWSTGIGRWLDERRWNLSFATKNLSTPDHNPAPRRVDRQTHSDRGQPYRLLVTSESRSVAQETLNLLWREFGGADLTPQRVSLKTHQPSGATRLQITVACDSARRVHLVHFVQQVGDLPGVRGVRWETVPPAEFESRAP